MKTARNIIFVLLLLSVGYAVVYYFPALLLPGELPKASAIGIIGGADGPTAIYVARTITPGMRILIAPAILFAAWLALYLKTRKRKR